MILFLVVNLYFGYGGVPSILLDPAQAFQDLQARRLRRHCLIYLLVKTHVFQPAVFHLR